MMGRHCARRSCPFCGWHCTDMVAIDSNRRGQRGLRPRPQLFHVECCACRGRGPEEDSREEASESWNGRRPRADRHGNVVELRLVKISS